MQWHLSASFSPVTCDFFHVSFEKPNCRFIQFVFWRLPQKIRELPGRGQGVPDVAPITALVRGPQQEEGKPVPSVFFWIRISSGFLFHFSLSH